MISEKKRNQAKEEIEKLKKNIKKIDKLIEKRCKNG